MIRAYHSVSVALYNSVEYAGFPPPPNPHTALSLTIPPTTSHLYQRAKCASSTSTTIAIHQLALWKSLLRIPRPLQQLVVHECPILDPAATATAIITITTTVTIVTLAPIATTVVTTAITMVTIDTIAVTTTATVMGMVMIIVTTMAMKGTTGTFIAFREFPPAVVAVARPRAVMMIQSWCTTCGPDILIRERNMSC